MIQGVAATIFKGYVLFAIGLGSGGVTVTNVAETKTKQDCLLQAADLEKGLKELNEGAAKDQFTGWGVGFRCSPKYDSNPDKIEEKP